MTPQEKKRLSLERDCRNCYGEHGKSRVSIRRRKAKVNRANRRQVHQALQSAHGNSDFAEVELLRRKRHRWRKCPDMPLGEFLKRRKNRRLAVAFDRAIKRDETFAARFSDHLKNGDKFSEDEIKLIERNFLNPTHAYFFHTPDFDLEMIRRLERLIRKLTPVEKVEEET